MLIKMFKMYRKIKMYKNKFKMMLKQLRLTRRLNHKIILISNKNKLLKKKINK